MTANASEYKELIKMIIFMGFKFDSSGTLHADNDIIISIKLELILNSNSP